MLKQLQNKAAEGFETVWLHIEDSTDYETNTFNVDELLELFDDNEKEYKGLYVENGNMYMGSGMCNVFIDEEECIIFCTNYLWELREEEGSIISLTEARREVLANSGKL